MESVGVLLMLLLGGVLAGAGALLLRERDRPPGTQSPTTGGESIATSILVQVLVAGGTDLRAAIARVADRGFRGRVTSGIDVCSWAETYARGVDANARHELLEHAVALVSGNGQTVPLLQYSALLDLDFGLGFHADTLARLRVAYPFDYVDHAKAGRPRSADRAARGSSRAGRSRSRAELLQRFGLEEGASRRELTLAYRRLVARHHPDRFHAQAPDQESAASARFIELTSSYQELLQIFDESFPQA